MTERAEAPDLEIRPAKASDAPAFLEFWRAVVAEERYVRTEVVDVPVRVYRRKFRRRSDDEIDLVAILDGRLVGHVHAAEADAPAQGADLFGQFLGRFRES